MSAAADAAADLVLVRRFKAGDEAAFEELVERYHARVYSLAYGVLRNPEDAEEATQDAFWTLYRKIGTFDDTKKFFSWFYRVALNQAYSRLRRRKPVPTVSIEDYLPRFRDGKPVALEVPDADARVEEAASARELAQRASEFIAELPRAYRDVIWMVDVEQMSPADVADTLGISIPALKSRLHRARLHVRERLSGISRAAAPAKAASS